MSRISEQESSAVEAAVSAAKRSVLQNAGGTPATTALLSAQAEARIGAQRTARPTMCACLSQREGGAAYNLTVDEHSHFIGAGSQRTGTQIVNILTASNPEV